MALQIVRKTRNLEKFIKKLQKTRSESVSTGYYGSQGNHSEYEMSYVELMQIHEYGQQGIPPRPVQMHTRHYMQDTYRQGWSLEIKKYISGKQSLDGSLHAIGIEATGYAKGLFGKSPPLTPNAQSTITEKGFNEPLVDTGELRDKWAYKTTSSPVITDVSFF